MPLPQCLVSFMLWINFLRHRDHLKIRVVPDFGSGKSGIPPFLGNPAKSGSGQISSQICRIWWLSVQLQYVQLITDKTNAADL